MSFAVTLVLVGLLGLSGGHRWAFGGFVRIVKPFYQYKPDLEPAR